MSLAYRRLCNPAIRSYTLFFLSVLNKMPRLFQWMFYSDRFAKVTDDGFFVSVEADDPKFDRDATRELLQAAGGRNIEIIGGNIEDGE